MKILYISHLSGDKYAGPNYSVPKQIAAQAAYDNVFWYNAVKSVSDWDALSYYHNLNEYPNERISSLPEPFNRPDLVIVEQFYNMAKSKLLWELINGDIPYIIIPRGELTRQAQNRKHLKKAVANFLVFNRYARKALAIQYLTEQERIDAGEAWNKNAIVIPNGITIPNTRKKSFSENAIKCVSIGRIEPYQKGLDLLIETCSSIAEQLRAANCSFTICGPDLEHKLDSLKVLVSEDSLSDIIQFRDGVYGADKEALLLESDVFIMTSRFEGHPMALLEALSYGLPCLVTTGSNMREEIDSHDAGWTADNTAESLEQALLSMLQTAKSIPEKGIHASELARKYEWARIAEKTHNIYSELLK